MVLLHPIIDVTVTYCHMITCMYHVSLYHVTVTVLYCTHTYSCIMYWNCDYDYDYDPVSCVSMSVYCIALFFQI